MKEKICARCGKKFLTDKRSPYCSDYCRTHEERICEICGSKFQALCNSSGTTCSKECGIEKKKRTSLEKYGVENISQRDDIKNKVQTKRKQNMESIQEKMKKTCLERYGVEKALQSKEIRKRIHETNIKKYGSKSILGNKEMRIKWGIENNFKGDFLDTLKENNLQKYGVEYNSQREDVKEKAKRTNLERYGNSNGVGFGTKQHKERMLERYGVRDVFSLPEIKEKIKEHNMEKYGVPWHCMTDKCRNSQGYTISRVNKRVGKILEVEEYEYPIKDKSYDLKKGDTLIEINPSFTHNCTYSFAYLVGKSSENKPLPKKYHQEKTELATKSGYRCIHVFDWDDLDKIKLMLKDKQTLYARNLSIKEVPEDACDEFLNKNHLQNTCKGQTVRLGLYKDDNLIEIMTFGEPRYNKNYEYELLRLCTSSDYKVVGGSEKLFKHFIDNYNPTSIISYCDNSKFSGEVYNKLGFTLKSFGTPSCHWYNIKTGRHITDNLLRQRGFSQLHGDNKYEKASKGDSNKELMINEGYVEVYDCGQSTFIWEKSSK